jgi:hypothetical protein
MNTCPFDASFAPKGQGSGASPSECSTPFGATKE